VHVVCYVFCSCQRTFIKGWELVLCLNGGLQRFLLVSPPQLPLPKRPGAASHNQRRQCQHPETQRQQGLVHAEIILAMTYLVALAFLAILASLASALFFMMKDGTDGRRKTSNMARALAFRVGFSILLFVCILIAWKLGYISPTGIPSGT
jgi:hypothetical protein